MLINRFRTGIAWPRSETSPLLVFCLRPELVLRLTPPTRFTHLGHRGPRWDHCTGYVYRWLCQSVKSSQRRGSTQELHRNAKTVHRVRLSSTRLIQNTQPLYRRDYLLQQATSAEKLWLHYPAENGGGWKPGRELRKVAYRRTRDSRRMFFILRPEICILQFMRMGQG